VWPRLSATDLYEVPASAQSNRLTKCP
jgi:hypothetical protein